ncbi:MAG: dihydroneopterin aldolase [Pedosphaera sp.]|nr:dihydroneopterin aldolase [Pedosphaera sp.]
MDTIVIRDLEVSYHVGVPDVERAQPQRLLISVEMSRDFSRAAATDELHETVDYFAVSRRVLHWGEGRSWKLIETLAVELAEGIRHEFGAGQVTVEIRKFILPEARYVSVRTTRPVIG